MGKEYLPQERREKILQELRLNGKVVAIELSAHYGVSEDTIRRDLRDLGSAGLLKRVHGGALPISPSTAPYIDRDKKQTKSKVALARAARELVHDGQVIILGSGTTNAEIAQHLPSNLKATIITASPQIALSLAEYQHIEVIVIGGCLNKSDLTTFDAEAVAQIKRFQADICFLGVCSVHHEVGITTNTYEEVAMDRAIIEQSGDVVATMTADKLGTIASFIVYPIEKITHIVTESSIDNEVISLYESLGTQVITVEC